MGVGLDPLEAKQLFPAMLLSLVPEVFAPVAIAHFKSLYGGKTLKTSIVYKLPETFSIKYQENPLYQSVEREGKELFYVYYSRDYNQIDIEISDLIARLEGLRLKIPRVELHPSDWKLVRYTPEEDWQRYEDLVVPEQLKNAFHKTLVENLRAYFAA